MFKEEKGITLVALVITIIILIILAAVTVITMSESKIFEKGTEAAKTYEEKQYAEKDEITTIENKLTTLEEELNEIKNSHTTTPTPPAEDEESGS